MMQSAVNVGREKMMQYHAVLATTHTLVVKHTQLQCMHELQNPDAHFFLPFIYSWQLQV